MSSQSAYISVGSIAGGLYLRPNGRATQRVCTTAERLVSDYLSTQGREPAITIDLTGCSWVDSTFAGWLVGLQKRLARNVGARLRLVGCSPRCRASLERIRLEALFEFSDAEQPEHVQDVECRSDDGPDRQTLELMARAHEELAATDAENQRIFAPIAELLRHQLKQAD